MTSTTGRKVESFGTALDRTLEPLERQSAPAFLLTGVLVLGSLVAPIVLGALTERSWVAGLVLVSLAVLTASVGLLGLYPRVNDRAPRSALAGAGAATVAGVAALGLLALVGVALVGEVLVGRSVSDPGGAFALLGLSMAGGFALGLLLFGVATRRTGTPSRAVGGLLTAGGAALLVPVVVELLGPALGVSTPPWLLFPVIGGVAVDAALIGYVLGPRE